METLAISTTTNTGVSSAEALWALIQKQSKNTRRAIAERLIVSDLEMSEQLLLKASIQRGWQQVSDWAQFQNFTRPHQRVVDRPMQDVLIIPSSEFIR